MYAQPEDYSRDAETGSRGKGHLWRERRNITVQDSLCHVDAVGVLLERVFSSGALHQHQPKAPDVTLVAIRLVLDAFRGHIFEGSHESATHGDGVL